MADQSTAGSFIPHDTAVAAPSVRTSRAGLNDLFVLIGIVLLVASGALAVGVFLYGQYLQQQSASKAEQLKRAEAAFQPALVEQITRVDDRMHAAQMLLSGHLAPVAFFQALNRATLQTVSFQSLDLAVPDPQHITLKMQGVAQSVNSIALQAEIFAKSGVITSPMFSNIARQKDGVHFNFAGMVNPAALAYTSFITAAGSAAPASQQIETTSSDSASSGSSPFGGAPLQRAPAQSTTPDQNPVQLSQ